VRRHRSGQFDALQERGRRDRALAELAELKLAEQRGRLVDAETVRRDWGDHIGRCRNRLLGLPTAAKTRLPDLTRADVVKLDELVREALEELAARAADDAREFDARDAAKAAAVRLEAAP
jgi:phage terminase Nu1 subunit (DNA packaging protein)